MAERIGIWGLGCVGMATLNFLKTEPYCLSVMNNTLPTPEQQHFLEQYQIPYFDQTEAASFFAHNDWVIPSPGIDLTAYQEYQHKFVAELDFFYRYFRKPCIAITGTLGKTTTTHLLTQTLRSAGKRVAMGGNVGRALFDLITEQKELDYAVLELSSFQLERACSFAPNLALITNIFPNHLDRHRTMQAYLQAKINVHRHQSAQQLTLLPLTLAQQLIQESLPLPVRYALFHETKPDTINSVLRETALYYQEEGVVYKVTDRVTTRIGTLAGLSTLTFTSNALLIAAASDALNIGMPEDTESFTIPEHRVELVATINNVPFYNDSKSTVPQATLAAVYRLAAHYNHQRPILLFLGGLDKGVDRAPLIASLATSNTVKMIFAFGAQAEQLAQLCTQYHQPCTAFATLEEAFAACMAQKQPDDLVLFSPSGASFDLFTHYEHRGKTFKKLVSDSAQLCR